MTQPRSLCEISLHSCLTVSHDANLNSGAGGATLGPRCPGGVALVESQEVGATHHLPPLQPLWRPQNQQKRCRWGFHHALQPAVQPEVFGSPHEAYGLLLTGVQAHSALCCTMTLCSLGHIHHMSRTLFTANVFSNSHLTGCMLTLCFKDFAAWACACIGPCVTKHSTFTLSHCCDVQM